MRSQLCFALLLCGAEWRGGDAQKISQGGSDWYLRFRSERDLDRPETVRFEVRSKIDHRYSVTTVRREIFNPANVSQGFEFAVMIPSTAFISNLEIGDSETELEAASYSQGRNTTPHQHSIFNTNLIGNEFSKFLLPVLLGPRENATLSITYEESLDGTGGLYSQDMFLRPGEIVQHFSVEIQIVDHFQIQDLGVHASILGDISNETLTKVESPLGGMVNFTMNTREQAHHFGSKGFYGTVSVQYSLKKPPSLLDVFFKDEYFVLFYEIPKDAKDLILVIENDSEQYINDVSKQVIEVSEKVKSFCVVYVIGDKAYLWVSRQNKSLSNFLYLLGGSSSSKPLPVNTTELKTAIFTNKNTLENIHLVHVTNTSSKKNSLRNYFDDELLATISVHPIEDLSEINKVKVDFEGNGVDKNSLTKTEFIVSNPEAQVVKVAGKVNGKTKDPITVKISSLFHSQTFSQSIVLNNSASPAESNPAKSLQQILFLQDSLGPLLEEDQVEKAIRISLKNNFITPFTKLVLKDETEESRTYTYDDLLSPHLHLGQSPCPETQDNCEHQRASSCPPLSVTSSQEGEVLISGSHPNLNLSDITQATQEGACCWLFFSEPGYAGDTQQFCGGEDMLNLDRIGSVKTV